MKNLLKISLVLFMLTATFFSCNGDDPIEEPTSNPSITTISPTNGPKTTIVTINGQDFGTNTSNVQVYFNEKQGTVQSVENTKIVAIVPARAFTGKVAVVVAGTEVTGPIFNYTIIDIQTSTFAGSGTNGFVDGQGTTAQFSTLGQMVVDANETIYVADAGNHRIRKITPSGVVSTLAGGTQGYADGQGTAAQFNEPYGITIDKQGNIYVADSNNNKIRKITANGVVSTVAGSDYGDADGQGTVAKFRSPYSITIDEQNNLYVADYFNHKIKKITPSSLVSTFAGSVSGSVDGQGANAQFKKPLGLAVDAQGNIYVGDEGNSSIRKITPNAVVTTLAGGTQGYADGQGTNAQFTSPAGLAVDQQGNIYVADYLNNRIRKITPNGLVSTFVGSTQGYTNGQGTVTQFNKPYCIVINSNNDVYVSDRKNYRIRKITQE